MSTIEVKATFSVPARVLYKSLLDAHDMTRVCRSPAEIMPEVGSKWCLFNSHVVGTIEELEENKKIVQNWRFQQWEEGVYSKVTITLEEDHDEDNTTVYVKQENIPKNDMYKNGQQDLLCKSGWEEKYFHGMTTMLGYPRDE